MKVVRLSEQIRIPGGSAGNEWGMLSGETLVPFPAQYRLSDEHANMLSETYPGVVTIVANARPVRDETNGNVTISEHIRYTKEGKEAEKVAGAPA